MFVGRAKGAVSLLTAAALLAVTGCSQDDADSGGEATPVSAEDIDPCEALTPETIATLEIPEGDTLDISDEEGPACNWRKLAPGALGTDVVLWVLEPGSHTESVGTVTISGLDVSIWLIDDDAGRYVVPCGDHELVINYLQQGGPLSPEDGLQLATEDVISTYGCSK